jgi:hypothetical protein
MPQITRTWSVPTSPRNPYKLINELKLLSKFEGEQWNKTTQAKFAEKLKNADFFEGTVSASEPDFSARDRINRAPKTFGFVRFDEDRKICITEAGRQLISEVRLEELFLRQLLKWQYPSVNHNEQAYRDNFCIKPFLEVLRIIRELDGIAKYELAIFCIPLIKHKDVQSTMEKIRDFRSSLSIKKTPIERKRFIKEEFKNKFRGIYREDLRTRNIHVRESRTDDSEEAFIRTKIRNAKDYADAAMRYFRATGLFVFTGGNYRLKILDTKWEAVEEILGKNNPDPLAYVKSPSDFLNYLGAVSLPPIPQDDVYSLISEIDAISERYAANKFSLEARHKNKLKDIRNLDIEKLKNFRDEIDGKLRLCIVQQKQKELRSYDLLPEIIDTFNKIKDRYNDEIPDKPLFLEWNVWRALSLLNDGKIVGNFKMDIDGMPISTAPGNMPDIECYYKDFSLIVEVTLATGQRQYETEGEPVSRHIGQIVKQLRMKGDNRPVYGLFIASTVNNSVVAHFFVISRVSVGYYGGKVKIVPIDIETFIGMLEHAKECEGIKAKHIHEFLKWMDAESSKFSGEKEWNESIKCISKDWTKLEERAEA